MLAFKEIKALIIALGTSIGEGFDLGRLRYHKIIIATDADVDGAHIRTLLLTLFYRHFRALIDAAHLYIAQPPLYKLKKGKEIAYAYSDDEKNKVVKNWGGEISTEGEDEETPEGEEETEVKTKRVSRIHIQRYKGLGEMNPEELWETTMDPEKRTLKRVTVDEAEAADRIFTILMGDEVEPRKLFIQTHAKSANLDI